MLSPDYEVLVDWDGDGGLGLGDFEFGLDGWSAGGTLPPSLAQSTSRSYHGSTSALITWDAGGTSPLIQRIWPGLSAGTAYSLSAWVFVPVGSVALKWTVAGISSGPASAATGAWVEITHTFTASAPSHALQIVPASLPAGGEQAWVDHLRITGPGEDVTGRVWDRTPIGLDYGRDQARSLSPVKPGELAFELDNTSRDYSPEHTGSPLADMLGPGRAVVVQATYDSKAYTLYRGYIDDYTVLPDPGDWSVAFTALDGVGRLREVDVSTSLHRSIQTGDAVHRVLDAVGWTGGRDIDTGATTLRWWWEEGTDASTALDRITTAEGPGSFVHIGASGEFVFRGRHHRLTRSASTTAQATFRDEGDELVEPVFDSPFQYDSGWKDIVNHVAFEVVERTIRATPDVIWKMYSRYQLGPGETMTFTLVGNTALFTDVITPTQGTNPDVDTDFVIVGSGTLRFELDRTSGQRFVLRITLPLGGSAVTLTRGRLRGYVVDEVSRVQVSLEDSTSIARHGRRTYTGTAPHINVHDALAVAQLIIGQRATRLPTVRIKVLSASVPQLTQQLTRDLSDRIHIVESQTGVDAPFYIEHISHSVRDNGLVHETVFGCEMVRTLPATTFRFDSGTAGFNDGRFAPTALDDPTSVFRFDTTGQGFDQGLLGT
ncbi:carbohydrate binding domain-containing protein [Saccharothrix texasensis]|uniref:CBM-cenC domain-containing protein n=1 Tax=Saccharothrix texasensis TaxID=103734 RepID=A0A3N1H182_9PSEU|nr:carbohydrate binding domain-containing protein [Saccharothrix texasensis]ROP36291.1 hypothetical protein EDD40_1556 [Saccharothrix texasensis]